MPAVDRARAIHSQYAIDLISRDDASRAEAEHFVRQGFKTNYGAIISDFMPALITLSDHQLKAVMGIRPATTSLAVEQYLEQPIELALARSNASRHAVVEVGNLVSTNRHATLTIFMLVTNALYQAGFRHMVFCATAQIAAILRRVGAKMDTIIEADGRRVGDSLAAWGKYYDHRPTVMHLDLIDAASLIQRSPLLRRHSMPYTEVMHDIARHLRRSYSTQLPVVEP